jgi:hypothetical protein
MSGVGSKGRFRRVQLKDGHLGGLRQREANEVSTSSSSSLAHRVRRRSSDSQTPMMYRAPSPIAQWWRSSPTPVAPPRLMINACALS